MSTHVTVNGKPLEEVLSKEAGREIAEVRSVEIREKSWKRPGKTKHHGASGARTLLGKMIYSCDQKETHAVIAGMIFEWHKKAPYVMSGNSILGGLEYNPSSGLIKCHECGDWYANLSVHVNRNHRISATAYKIRHGLRSRTGLWSPKLSERIRSKARHYQLPSYQPTTNEMRSLGRVASVNAKTRLEMGLGFSVSPETANLRSQCRAQLSLRIAALAQTLGRTPTTVEFAANGIYMNRVASIFGMPAKDVLSSLGLVARARGWQQRVSA